MARCKWYASAKWLLVGPRTGATPYDNVNVIILIVRLTDDASANADDDVHMSEAKGHRSFVQYSRTGAGSVACGGSVAVLTVLCTRGMHCVGVLRFCPKTVWAPGERLPPVFLRHTSSNHQTTRHAHGEAASHAAVRGL